MASAATARTWTDTNGRTVDAEVVKVNADQTVVLKLKRGKVVTVPFSTFVPEDVKHLDYLLSRKGRGKLHPVPWADINQMFGIEIWMDDYLWNDSPEITGKRIKLKKESKTDFMENHRAYPLGKKKILNEPVYAVALYGKEERVDSLSFVFLNAGDIPHAETMSPRAMKEQIERCGIRVHAVLENVLGEPKRDTLGKGDLREKVWRWDWNGHALMLSVQEGKYVAMRIMTSDRADHSGRTAKITESELKKRMASCIRKRKTGDVVIDNIPMINQGPKGYCSPATWERYLRYMDIPADMYLLALAGNTGAGGGTYAHEMLAATKGLVSANGREMESLTDFLSIESVSECIDQGLPIMWRLMSTPSFQVHAMNNTARRNGKETQIKNSSGQDEDESAGGHICLIIGYNQQTDEIAISDSWGPRYAERWVRVNEAQQVSYGSMNIIKW